MRVTVILEIELCALLYEGYTNRSLNGLGMALGGTAGDSVNLFSA